MNAFSRKLFVPTVLFSLWFGATMTIAQDNTPPAWKPIEDAIQQGLPKTAIEQIERLLPAAIAEQQNALVARAIATRATMQGQLEGRDEVFRITRLQTEIDQAPEPTRPILRAILANWLWGYYQQNQWRFRDRTEIDRTEIDRTEIDRTEIDSGDEDDAPSGQPLAIRSQEDLTTWSRQRIVAQSRLTFEAALADADLLKTISIQTYDALLVKGNAPDAYRPTLYDFVVADAIAFDADADETYAGPAEAFELTAASPILGDAAEFLAWKIPTTDPNSPLYHAARLHQDWMTFHRDDSDPSAYLDADLNRLMFGHDHVTGDADDERYMESLRRFISAHQDHPISARAQFLIASDATASDDPARGREIALAAIKAHPDSIGASQCQTLVEMIEMPSISIATERIWNPTLDQASRPKITVSYKNLTRVHFRLVSIKDALSPNVDLDSFGRDEQVRVLDTKPTMQWSESLPETTDYRIDRRKLDANVSVPRGGYFLIASTSDQFPDKIDYTAITQVWVSGLSLVIDTDYSGGEIRGFVVDGKSGEPIPNAKVKATGFDPTSAGNNRRPQGELRNKTLAELSTDKSGRFDFNQKNIRNLRFEVNRGNDSLLSTPYYTYDRNAEEPGTQTRSFFFTDRSIYRPGQTLKFKIIATRSNPTTNRYNVAKGEQLEVDLLDTNGKIVHTQVLKTNDHGSCHHSFNLPTAGLTGRMTLRVNGAFAGSASVQVEEYKRPKFEVELSSPEKASSLNQEVTVPGIAKAYTGAPIDAAKVTYTVTRETQMPPWFGWRCWWMPMPPAFPQSIATGETETDESGKFEIKFDAIPDNSIDRENEPVFNYVVTADVTDTTGETRTDSFTVPVGYALISATMSVTDSDWLIDDEPIAVAIKTQTLQNSPVSTDVTVKIHSLKSPERIGRKPLDASDDHWNFDDEPDDAPERPDVLAHDPNSWPIDQTVRTESITTDAAGNATLDANLPSGFYRVELSGVDATGQSIQAILPLRVINPVADDCQLPIASFVATKTQAIQPGETFTAVWGSGYESARAHVTIEHRGKILESYWTPVGQTQVKITREIDESMRGGFYVRVFTVLENRLYTETLRVNVPWSNKELKVRWERFTSKLKPGQKETWTAVIEGASENQIAEMVATLYDASLDLFQPHNWTAGFGLFYQDALRRNIRDENSHLTLQTVSAFERSIHGSQPIAYRRFPHDLMSVRGPAMYSRTMMKGSRGALGGESEAMGDFAVAPMMAMDGEVVSQDSSSVNETSGEVPPTVNKEVDLSDVSPRRNLNETAFFFPELTADENGTVSMKFTMPEALTRWQLIGFAHTNDLASGSIRDTTVTSKDLMVQPNPPRVLREGDRIEMTVKVTNQSPTVQTGTVALQFNDARTGESVDVALENNAVRQDFEIAAGRSQSFSWPIVVPDGMGFLTYKAVGSTGRLSDGEEGYLAVLSRRVLVHESIALPINGPETKTFTLDKLAGSDGTTIDSESLTVQMTSNPAWYAVMALPYLMDYPYECSEQTFNRLYANLLARHIATSDPKIERVFEQWRNQPVAADRKTLDSPLQQNQEIASIALTETPWVLEAESESEARRNVGNLFDQNRVNDQVTRWTTRINDTQLDDGSWPWFPGGPSNSFITLYITTGYGRLRHLGVDGEMSSAIKSLNHLDQFALKMYEERGSKNPDDNQLSPIMAMYLYGRSFYLDDMVISPEADVAVQYWLDQAAEHWLSLPGRMSQAHAAVALKRFGRTDDALAITASLKERSVTDDQGMHWNDAMAGWFWYQAGIESQAMMIEAFDEVAGDQPSVEACKSWLLRQKETQSWDTTKATADAVYALLLRGTDLLADATLVDVNVGDTPVDRSDVEAGTGFYQQRFAGDEIDPSMGSITVTKTTPGIAWGGVHWKFFQNIDEVTPHEGTPLKIEKQLFVIRDTPTGEVMQPIVDGRSKTPVKVGDEIVARLIVRTDRAMEFIHLKDGRGSGTEPTNVLSRYRFQDGLAYYQSTRDAAEHFFIDTLAKGTFVIESRSRVQLNGEYQSGLATIECMYAPQYNSHSESHVLRVGE